jgi:hypothetical protein
MRSLFTVSKCFRATSYTWAISLLAAVHLAKPDPVDGQGCPIYAQY